jgi:predicted GNAT family acetyltransferase
MIKEMNTFNNQLFSMSIEDLNNTKDLIADIIQSKIKSVMKVGMKVNIVQKTKKTSGVIKKIMQKKCLVTIDSGVTYRVPMSMLEVA